MHRGQSNAHFAHDPFNAPEMLRATFASLTGLPVDMISSPYDPGKTLFGGTSSYIGDNFPWLVGTDNDYGSPSGWSEDEPARSTLGAVDASVSTDQQVPLFDFRLHWEYDLAMDGQPANAYAEGHYEMSRRILARRPKAAGKYILSIGYCPYEGGSWRALNRITSVWAADTANPSRSAIMACGNMLDADQLRIYDPNGDLSHWGVDTQRIYPRVAFNFAKVAYDRGWCPPSVNLSDCPSVGPRIASAARNGNSVNGTVQHDKGTSLVAGQGGIDWSAFAAGDASGNIQFNATGGQITSATSFRVDFPGQPLTGGRLWYCHGAKFMYRNLVRDNWHSVRPSKYGGVPNIAAVEFPLQRTLTGVPYGDALAATPNTTAVELSGPVA